MEEKGERRTFWMSNDLDGIVEDVRTKLGMSKSGFYRYAVTKLLQDLGVLERTVNQEVET